MIHGFDVTLDTFQLTCDAKALEELLGGPPAAGLTLVEARPVGSWIHVD